MNSRAAASRAGDADGTAATRWPRVAIWGTFDLANFGDLLFPRIFVHEMERRLPRVDVRVFSPLGCEHPVPLDGGFVAEPLGRWSAERAAALAQELDLVAIGGGEIIHTQDELYDRYYDIDRDEARRLAPSSFFIEGVGSAAEARCAVVWHGVGIPFDFEPAAAARVVAALRNRPYVAVRDERSRERLERAGVEREIAVVPDSGFVVGRVLTDSVLEKRLAYLRAVEWYPTSEPPVVVQGSIVLIDHVDAVADALMRARKQHPAPVVLLETGPCHGDGAFADALRERLGGLVFRMPGDVALEDIATAIAHARAFVGISMHGTILAAAHGVPVAVLNLAGYSKLASLAETLGLDAALASAPADLPRAIGQALSGVGPDTDFRSLERRIDAHFDTLAELAERSAREREACDGAGDSTAAALREADRRYAMVVRAHRARGERLIRERLRFAEVADLASLRATVAALEAQLAESERLRFAEVADLASLRATVAALEAQLAEIESTKLLRYTRRLRGLYASLRRAR